MVLVLVLVVTVFLVNVLVVTVVLVFVFVVILFVTLFWSSFQSLSLFLILAIIVGNMQMIFAKRLLYEL